MEDEEKLDTIEGAMLLHKAGMTEEQAYAAVRLIQKIMENESD